MAVFRGFPYYHYAETVNLLSSEFPFLRRLLQPAWDLAFAWQREEPPVHHSALPWQILLAMLAICVTWGWIDIAGLLALSWGLARIGEVLAACRADLVLPSDTGEGLRSSRGPRTKDEVSGRKASVH